MKANVLVVFPLKIRHGLHLYTCGIWLKSRLEMPATNVILFFSFETLLINTSVSPQGDNVFSLLVSLLYEKLCNR